jgi:hypothetical protein
MEVELRPIGSIKPYENNPRQNDQAVEAVVASIRELDSVSRSLSMRTM